MKKIDHVGERYGRLLVVAETSRPARLPPRKGGATPSYWKCLCDCGNTSVVVNSNLDGRTRSCGCLKNEMCGNMSRTHGDSKTPLYEVWRNMIRRCNDPEYSKYPEWGGRGIKVAPEWEDYLKFRADMGDSYRRGLSLERKNNDGNYSKSNCCWATQAEQTLNTRKTLRVTFRGETMALKAWTRRLGLNYHRIWSRIHNRGWPIEKAFTAGYHEF